MPQKPFQILLIVSMLVTTTTATAQIPGPPPGSGPLPLGGRLDVDGTIAGDRLAPRVAAAPGGGFLVVWQGRRQESEPWRVFGRLYATGGESRGAAFRLADREGGDQVRPEVTVANGGYFAVWTDGRELRGRRVAPGVGGAPALGPERPLGECFGNDCQMLGGEPSFAADGSFVVAWDSFTEGAYLRRVSRQRFDAAEEPLTEEKSFGAIVGGPEVSSAPAGDFVMVWNDAAVLEGQLFDAQAEAVPGSEFQVSGPSGDGNFTFDVAHQPGEGFVVVWQEGSESPDPGITQDYDVFGRRYDRDGQALGEGFRINRSTVGKHVDPRLAVAADGSFVVVWTNEDGEGGRMLFGQNFLENGVALGQNFPLYPESASQRSADVAFTSDGEMVTVWETEIRDKEYKVFGRRFAASSCRTGPRILCLRQGRFSLEVAFQEPSGRRDRGHSVPLTTDTGAFWFFNDKNLELVVKVLDGRAFTGHYWVFYGSLSNVAFTLTVTDTVTGATKEYRNPQGTFASVGDVMAIPGNLP